MKQFYSPFGDDEESDTGPKLRSLPFVLGWGVLLPFVIGWYAVEAWQTGSVIWPIENPGFFKGYEALELDGDAARSVAVAYGAVAVFLNGWNCWGAMGFRRTCQVMSVVSCLVLIAGVISAASFGFGGW